jgi:hypothetical protein
MEGVIERLVALEHQMHKLSQYIDDASSVKMYVGKTQPDTARDTKTMADQQPQKLTQQAAEAIEDAGADAMRQLHPAFTSFLNRC